MTALDEIRSFAKWNEVWGQRQRDDIVRLCDEAEREKERTVEREVADATKQLPILVQFYREIDKANYETKTEKDFRKAVYAAYDKASAALKKLEK
jgi:hypothetical protein